MCAWKLTPLGESRALRTDRVRDPENAIVTLLYEEKDALETEEIAGETRMNEDSVGLVLKRLVSKGYVKEI